jgi:hypothetical protein
MPSEADEHQAHDVGLARCEGDGLAAVRGGLAEVMARTGCGLDFLGLDFLGLDFLGLDDEGEPGSGLGDDAVLDRAATPACWPDAAATPAGFPVAGPRLAASLYPPAAAAMSTHNTATRGTSLPRLLWAAICPPDRSRACFRRPTVRGRRVIRRCNRYICWRITLTPVRVAGPGRRVVSGRAGEGWTLGLRAGPAAPAGGCRRRANRSVRIDAAPR